MYCSGYFNYIYYFLYINLYKDKNKYMSYFNYHGTAHRLISQGKLIKYYYTEKHNSICPALVLVFDDVKHPVMPIRKERWCEYENILPKDKLENH